MQNSHLEGEDAIQTNEPNHAQALVESRKHTHADHLVTCQQVPPEVLGRVHSETEVGEL